MSNKVTLWFRADSGYGWSETYYTNASPSNWNTQVNALISRRMALSGTDVFCTRARINTGTQRVVQILAAGGGSGFQGSQPRPTCSETVALMVRLQAAAGEFNMKFVRGIPERVISQNTFVPDTLYSGQVAQYLNQLTNGTWSVQGRLNSAGAAQPMNTIQPVPPRGVSFQCPGLTLAVGNVVRISQISVPGYNGQKVVTGVSTVGGTTTYTVGGAAPPVAPPLGQGLCRLLGQVDQPVATAVVVAVSSREAGRFFGLSRGRRATLYSLRR